MAEHV
jgi:hypothetical protein